MTDRLVVRVSPRFFEDLDRQLGPERGPHGEPSAIDFQAVELIEIIDEFATGFDQLPRPIEGRDDYRLLIKTGVLVRGISVTAQQVSDGAVELLRLDLDLSQEWDLNE
ncbi:MAG: hypothetical protein KJN63_04680 [Acidimicrobiia bacterium]|nr:hypothetical protein [Acidimicrobiia bacterium]